MTGNLVELSGFEGLSSFQGVAITSIVTTYLLGRSRSNIYYFAFC